MASTYSNIQQRYGVHTFVGVQQLQVNCWVVVPFFLAQTDNGLLEGVFCLPVIIDSAITIVICYILHFNQTAFHKYARSTLFSNNNCVIIWLSQNRQQDL